MLSLMTNLAHRNLNIISEFEFSGIIILPCVIDGGTFFWRPRWLHRSPERVFA